MSWLLIKRSEGKKPVICFSSQPRHAYKDGHVADKDCAFLNGRYGPELTYTVEEWPTIKAAIASGYRLAK